MKRATLFIAAVIAAAGCHRAQMRSQPVAEQPPIVTDVVAKKPFIALPHPFTGPGPKPSLLLQLHARSDSPISLAEYGKQKTYSLKSFDLNSGLSASELQNRLGPPAQLADYSDPWFVYRLEHGKELWLHFSQPDNARLLAADVVHGQEDGYTRDRVFSADGSR